MKKKIISLCLVVALIAVAVVGGTLAYFTDNDSDVNVMTTGNVKIVQNEEQRPVDTDGQYIDGALVAWNDNPDLWPAVYYKPDADGNYTIPYNPAGYPDKYSPEGPGGYTNRYDDDGNDMWYPGSVNHASGTTVSIYDENIRNEIDKIVSVTNRGTESAWIRTIILFENSGDGSNDICDAVHLRYGFTPVWVANADGSETLIKLSVDGKETWFSIAVFTYPNPLAAGATSTPSLIQFFLDPATTNDWYDLVDEQYSIIAMSQAVQEEGFDDAETALNLAFGEVNADNVYDWIEKYEIKTTGVNNVVGGEISVPVGDVSDTLNPTT